MSRRFWRLWTAAFCSEVGEWMLQIALPVLVYRATGSATSTAAMMIVGMLPAVLLSPVTGVLADRVHRPALLLTVCLGQALVAAPLLLDDGLCWVVMALQTSLAAFFEPARNALVADLVPADRVTAANGLLASGNNVARLVGAWLGGTLLAAGGVALVYVVYAAVLCAGALALVGRFPRTRKEKRSPSRDWLDGIADIRRDRGLWTFGVALTLSSVGQGMFLVLYVPFVLDTLAAGPEGVGLLRGVQAIGGLAAGFVIATVARRVRPDRLLGWGSICFGLLCAVIWHGPAATTALGVYVGLFVAVGVPGVAANTGLLATLQTSVAPAAVGRLLATALAVMALGATVGMLVAGAAADAVGTTALLDGQAALYLVAGTLVLAHQHRHRLRDAHRPGGSGGAGGEPAQLHPGQQRDDRAGQPIR